MKELIKKAISEMISEIKEMPIKALKEKLSAYSDGPISKLGQEASDFLYHFAQPILVKYDTVRAPLNFVFFAETVDGNKRIIEDLKPIENKAANDGYYAYCRAA